MNPTVSLITTFYNSVSLGDFVHKAMKSLLSQTYTNLELVCVNDGSTDETLAQLQEYAAADSRIIIIDKPNEGTAQYAKAAGQDAATGDFVMLFDHDDELSPDAIETAVQTFEGNPALDMMGLIVKTVYSSGELKNIFSLNKPLKTFEEYQPHTLNARHALQETIGPYDFHFRGLYRMTLFKKVSFRYTEKLLNADEIVERQLLLHAHQIGSCNGVYTHFVFENSSAKSFSLKQTDITVTDMHLREFARKHDLYNKRKEKFEKTAYRNLINGFKAYHSFRPKLSKTQRLEYGSRLQKAYNALDKEIVVKQFTPWAKLYHRLLLSRYPVISTFYRFKQ